MVAEVEMTVEEVEITEVLNKIDSRRINGIIILSTRWKKLREWDLTLEVGHQSNSRTLTKAITIDK